MSYIWPLTPDIPITQHFGENPGGNNPPGGHNGIDFAAPVGTPVYAPGDGVIEWADWVDETWQDNPLWLMGGIAVILNCGDDEPSFVFGHLSDTPLNIGDRVRQGQELGHTGNTGHSSGPHLHFECLLPGYTLSSPTLGRSDPAGVCQGHVGDLSVLTPASAPAEPVRVPVGPLRGIDVSSHNGYVDFAAVRPDWVAVKVSEGIGWEDTTPSYDWREQVRRARAAGAQVCYYHFGRPTPQNDPKIEADWFVRCVQGMWRPGDEVALDWENHPNMAPGEDYTNVAWARQFLASATARLSPSRSLLYSYTALLQTPGVDWSPVSSTYPLWHAEYGANGAQSWGPAAGRTRTPIDWPAGVAGWQYTSSGRVPGHPGLLDLNEIYPEDIVLTDDDIERIAHALLVKAAYDGGPQLSQVLKDLHLALLALKAAQ